MSFIGALPVVSSVLSALASRCRLSRCCLSGLPYVRNQIRALRLIAADCTKLRSEKAFKKSNRFPFASIGRSFAVVLVFRFSIREILRSVVSWERIAPERTVPQL
jgi:hypothetical protein